MPLGLRKKFNGKKCTKKMSLGKKVHGKKCHGEKIALQQMPRGKNWVQ